MSRIVFLEMGEIEWNEWILCFELSENNFITICSTYFVRIQFLFCKISASPFSSGPICFVYFGWHWFQIFWYKQSYILNKIEIYFTSFYYKSYIFHIYSSLKHTYLKKNSFACIKKYFFCSLIPSVLHYLKNQFHIF